MNKKREGIVLLQVPITEGMREELYTEIERRVGYVKRGILSEIVIEALREYLNKKDYERSKEMGKKNGLALLSDRSGEVKERINPSSSPQHSVKKARADSDIYRIVNEIFRRYPTVIEDRQILDINLRNLIRELFGISDERPITNKINMLKASKIIDVDSDSLPVIRYNINVKKEVPALNGLV